MVSRGDPMVASEIIACIAEAREPTVLELGRVADRIERDVWGYRSAFIWGRSSADRPSRLISMRIALAALAGDCADRSDVTGMSDPCRATEQSTGQPPTTNQQTSVNAPEGSPLACEI
jgi:hypothetical protein